MRDQIAEEVKEARKEELMELQQEIVFAKNKQMRGRILTVMVEGYLAEENVYVARTYADTPDVDGYLFIETDQTLISGDFVKVKVTGAQDYDLIGEIEDELTQ